MRVFADKNQDLFVVPAGGGEAKQITFDKTIINSLAWDADGRNIFFVSYRGGTQSNVWRVSTDGGEMSEVAATSGRDISNVAVAPDGKSLAFVELKKNADIWRVAANQPTAERFAASIYSEQDASFSPDDSRVAFSSNRTGKYAVWLADADGKNLRQLTDSLFIVGNPRFSPGRLTDCLSRHRRRKCRHFRHSGRRRHTAPSDRKRRTKLRADVERGRHGDLFHLEPHRRRPNLEDSGERRRCRANHPQRSVRVVRRARRQNRFLHETNQTRRTVASSGKRRRGTKSAGIQSRRFYGRLRDDEKRIYFFARASDQFLKIKFYEFADGKIKDAAEDYKTLQNISGNFDATDDGSVFLYSLLDQKRQQHYARRN